MTIIESLKLAYGALKYRNNWLQALIAGLVYGLVYGLGIIPLVGAFLLAYLLPRVTVWFYRNIGFNVNPNYDVAFKALLIPSIIAHIGIIVLLVSSMRVLSLIYALGDYYGAIDLILKYGLVSTVLSFIAGVAYLLLLYTIYGSIVGKVNQLKIEIGKSIQMFILTIIVGIVATIIMFLLALIPYVGWVLMIVFSLLLTSYVNLALGILAAKL